MGDYKLFVEDSFQDLDYAIEMNESTGEKKYVIKGTFSTPERKNRNGRIYPRSLWEKNLREWNEVVKNDPTQTLMELEHPPRSTVDKWNAVGKIRKLEMRGDKVYGEAVILNNNSKETNQIKALIDEDMPIGVSSRGVGKLGSDGIVEDFKLITFDIVSNPSDYNATLEGFNESMILESKTFDITEDGKIVCDENGCRLKENKIKYSNVKTRAQKILESLEEYLKEDEKVEKSEYQRMAEKMLAKLKGEEYIDEETTSADIAGSIGGFVKKKKKIIESLEKIVIFTDKDSKKDCVLVVPSDTKKPLKCVMGDKEDENVKLELDVNTNRFVLNFQYDKGTIKALKELVQKEKKANTEDKKKIREEIKKLLAKKD